MTGARGRTAGRASFGAHSTRSVLHTACSEVGLKSENAELLRLGENAIYRLADEPVVVRIARTMNYWNDVVKEVRVARWLSGHSFPAAKLHDVPQPIVADGHPVTFWRFIDGRAGTLRDVAILARLLRRLHVLPAPTEFELEEKNILDRTQPRIEASSVSAEDKAFLLDRLAMLHDELPRLSFPLPSGPIHGDAHTENLMVCNGDAYLIDFERFSWGHPEWDLALAATEHLTAGWWTDAEYATFVETYGYDITTWSGFELLRITHEMKMTTWLMQNVQESPEIAKEFQARMHTLRTGRPERPWRPF